MATKQQQQRPPNPVLIETISVVGIIISVISVSISAIFLWETLQRLPAVATPTVSSG